MFNEATSFALREVQTCQSDQSTKDLPQQVQSPNESNQERKQERKNRQ